MFQNLINNLGSEYEPFKKVFRTGKLVDAFEELNKIEDEKSDLLKAFVLILLKKLIFMMMILMGKNFLMKFII